MPYRRGFRPDIAREGVVYQSGASRSTRRTSIAAPLAASFSKAATNRRGSAAKSRPIYPSSDRPHCLCWRRDQPNAGPSRNRRHVGDDIGARSACRRSARGRHSTQSSVQFDGSKASDAVRSNPDICPRSKGHSLCGGWSERRQPHVAQLVIIRINAEFHQRRNQCQRRRFNDACEALCSAGVIRRWPLS